MIERFRHFLLTPRLWMSAGLLCLGASLVIGYHQDQLAADTVMAEKVGAPHNVLIQNFDPGQRSNLLSEVSLTAEAVLSQTVMFNAGTAELPKMVRVFPVYGVSAQSIPLAMAYINRKDGSHRRPMPRAAASVLAEIAQSMHVLDGQPLAIIISEADVEILPLGEGANGTLIAISGVQISGATIQTGAVQALAAAGIATIPDLPVFSPYPDGRRPVAPSKNFTTLRTMLDWLAVGMVLLAILSVYLRWRRARPGQPNEFEEVEAVGAFPGVSQPVHAQEDQVREAQESAEQEASAVRRKLSRLAHPSGV